MAANPIPFALFPGEANADILDFSLDRDMKHFKMAIKGLDTKFDLKPKGLKVFLESVKERSNICAWGALLSIPGDGNPPVINNIIDRYGIVTLTQCRNRAITYVNGRNRTAQDSAMLYQFLSNSVTDEAKYELQSDAELYTIGGRATGVCFLKVIISKAHVDTIATVNTLRTAVSNLHHKMTEVQGDIKEFNAFVKQTTNALTARGERCDELMVNLLKAYAAVEDDEFKTYIRIKRLAYEDGAMLTTAELMSGAENQYRMRVEDGSWKQPDKKDEKIMALQANIETFRTMLTKATNKGTNRNRSKDKDQSAWAWKKVPPKDEEQKSKMVKGKKYHWCKNHQMWTVHTPEECTGKKISKQTEASSSTVEEKEDKTPELTMIEALKALIHDDDQYEE
jgi:hypothetical protein